MVVYFAFLFHIYQPPVQIPSVIKQIVNESYKPIMEALRDHPEAKITLNINGTLTEQLHDFGYDALIGAISFDDTIKLIQNFNNKLIQDLSLDSDVLEEIIYKIIFTAQKFEDNLVPLKLCKEMFNSNQKVISFCMGPLGIFSRITCILAGSYFTYASLEEKTASGQINVNKMKEMYKLIINNQ